MKSYILFRESPKRVISIRTADRDWALYQDRIYTVSLSDMSKESLARAFWSPFMRYELVGKLYRNRNFGGALKHAETIEELGAYRYLDQDFNYCSVITNQVESAYDSMSEFRFYKQTLLIECLKNVGTMSQYFESYEELLSYAG